MKVFKKPPGLQKFEAGRPDDDRGKGGFPFRGPEGAGEPGEERVQERLSGVPSR